MKRDEYAASQWYLMMSFLGIVVGISSLLILWLGIPIPYSILDELLVKWFVVYFIFVVVDLALLLYVLHGSNTMAPKIISVIGAGISLTPIILALDLL